MFFGKGVLSGRQVNEIFILFKCGRKDFAVRRLADGYLISLRNKEYRVKFSEGLFPKIVYAKEVQRVPRARL